ncbi:hypothetical protein MTR67_027476 [Solanum verrucosum]|uniref:Uncharacterized protein n=1 Tax=Solanum verrucosum TaxID=315347 RepID=A0AAF0R984_SOLVR|nr:hypothetical protein MTR67_027476 [Solanum verrucosum]
MSISVSSSATYYFKNCSRQRPSTSLFFFLLQSSDLLHDLSRYVFRTSSSSSFLFLSSSVLCFTISAEGFNAKVRDWWESFNYTGRPDYVLMAKLKALKGKLKEWRKPIQGNLKMQKANVLKQLADLEEIQEQRSLEEREITSRLALTMELVDIAKHEEIT